MTSNVIEKIILENFPPATVNNSRAIIRKKVKYLVDKYDKCPSEATAHQIENLIGLSADHSDADWGTGPRGGY